MAKKKKKGGALVKILMGMNALLILATVVLLWYCFNINDAPGGEAVSRFFGLPEVSDIPTQSTEPIVITEPETEPTEPPTTLPAEPEHVVARATIGAVGDVMMDLPMINAGLQPKGGYDFEPLFRYFKDYSRVVDYAVAGLETTLAGSEIRYSGFNNRNCPDEIVDALKDAGFDMILTANEHAYDTGSEGLLRTIKVIQKRGLAVLGTRADVRKPSYQIVDINGIQVGMMNYTYETPVPADGTPGTYLGGVAVAAEDAGKINSYLSDRVDLLFADVQNTIREMKDKGAEATVLFLHWGKEYSLKATSEQQGIAQKLCDLGVDVIVGSHPHVVEPIEVLTSSTDNSHKTYCIYSVGNAVSNQRYDSVARISTAHTEDGAWFTMTFAKYSDGMVFLEDIYLVPTWVDMRPNMAKEYCVIPLDESYRDGWSFVFDLTELGLKGANSSFKRTTNVVGKSLTAARESLAAAVAERETAYAVAWEALTGVTH